MGELRLSKAARTDLIDIRDQGVREFGAAVSARHLAGFDTIFTLLRERPLVGAQRPEFGPDLRSLNHAPHRVLYKVEDQKVLIVRIIHQARDVRRTMRARP